ncbi:MAG TPA: flagellar hook-basal body complex protein [Steroidobacteraceae bacterium]
MGLSGMNAYAKGLDVISNNVANLNTTGFKEGIASFSNVVSRSGGGATTGSAGASTSGGGVQVNAESQNFSQGDRQSTNQSLDAALDGNGFFVLERDGQRYYTRAGQFVLDKDGILTEQITGARVMMSSEGSSMGALNIDPFRTFPPRATTEVKLSGNLARSGTDLPTIPVLEVIDTAGNKQSIKIRFVRNAEDPLLWQVEVLNAVDVSLGSGALRFNADGTPSADNSPITATVTPENLPPFTFTLNFGGAGSYGGMTSLLNNPASAPNLLKQDGLQFGTFEGANFDERGNLEATYSNQEKKKIGRLVLASFDSSGDLTSVGNGMYVTQEGRSPKLSAGMEFGLGRVEGGKLEMSNVELTDQFTTLIILQRGYQACSQMTSVANEMMQQLLSMQSGR